MQPEPCGLCECEAVWTLPGYLDCLGRLQRLLRGDPHLALPQQLLGEVGDVSPGDGNVLYTAADDVTFSLEERGEQRSGGVTITQVLLCSSCISTIMNVSRLQWLQLSVFPSLPPPCCAWPGVSAHVQQRLQTC